MRLLLDTSVLMDALRLRHHRRELLAELVQAGHTLATTALNVAEVYAGMRSDEAQRTEALLAVLDCYELTGTSGRRAGALKQRWAKKGRTLALADMIVAAIALERGCTLMTDNRKDFPMEELDKFDLDRPNFPDAPKP
jgi:predicted nucleic acid-binding protein